MFDRYLDQFRVALGIALLCAVLGGVWYFYEWAYDRGAEHTQIEWDKEKAELTTAALKASEAARLKEKSLNLSVERVSRDYQKLQAAHAIATADLERVQHDFETALNSRCAENPSATGCTDAARRLEQKILGSCATALVELAKIADSLTAKTVGLQDYIKSTQ
jgi:hypothetical protein